MKRELSLRVRVLLFYYAVVMVIILTFFGMNRYFWGSLNMKRNQRDLLEIHSEFSMMLKNPETTVDDLIEMAADAKNRKNVNLALQGNSDWSFMLYTNQTMSPFERDFLMKRLQSDLLMQDVPEEGARILKKTNDYVLQQVDLPQGTYLECFGYMTDAYGQEKKFILSMAIEGIHAISQQSNVFFIWLCVGLLIVGGITIWIVTHRITKPILQLNDISKRMSNLDFSARFTGEGRDEIGELGNNMNEMSSQLERAFLQLKMSNEELKRENEEKSHIDEMRRDFISNVSHELKTPIALIQGYAEGLKDFGKDDPDSMDYYIDVITDEADKMNRMVKKLMTLNQLEFGADGLDIHDFDLMQMIRELVRNSKKMQEEHGAQVIVDGPESLVVSADEFKIEEVLNNYFSNALNHVEAPGEIRFTYDDLGPMVRVSVHNTGKQIPEEDLSKVWIKFYKVDKARTRAYGGSGIGLSIVKAIMDAHRTECGVYNTGDGVTFWFELRKAEYRKTEMDENAENEKAQSEMELFSDVMNGEIIGE